MNKDRLLRLVDYNNINYSTLMGSVKIKHRDPSFWYLTGKLEDMIGYDKASIYDGLKYSDTRRTIDWSTINGNEVTSVRSEELIPMLRLEGEFPVELYGITEPATGFFWITDDRFINYKGIGFSDWNQRGLVVLNSDKESLDDARDKFNKRVTIL